MRSMLHQILFFSFLLFILPPLGNTQCTSSMDGAWTASATWGGTNPGTCTNFIISATHTVKINAFNNIGVTNGSVTINGTLDLCGAPFATLSLTNTPLTVVGGSITGDANGLITSGGSAYALNLGFGITGTFAQIVAAGGLNASGGLLPIELLSFYATTQTNSIALHWQTALEVDNDYMAVERSRDGKAFEEIGRIAGKGTTDLVQEYRFFDEKPFPGLNYYRLRQVDFDGTTAYHRVIAVVFGAFNNDLSVFPTVAKEQVFIHWNKPLKQEVTVQVIDISGQVLTRQQLEAETQSTSLRVDQLPSGHYFLHIRSYDEVKVEKFIKP